jgi:TonB family protein
MKRIFAISSALLCLVFTGLVTAQSAIQNSVLTQTQAGKKEPPRDDVPYDHAPLPIDQVTPKYPELALRAGLEGTVWVKMWVDESGKVVKASVTKSDAEIFNQAAQDAAMKWTFRPALMKGKQVAVWVSVPFRFKIAGYPSETTTERSLGKMVLAESRRLGIPELLVIAAAILLFWLIPLIFAVIALVSILKSQFPGTNDKIIWTIVSIFVPIIGPILYFVLGRKQRTQIA